MIARRPNPEVVYPSSDGKPMAENTLQFQWIVTIEGNLEALFRDREDVFVAAANLWYPFEGHPNIRIDPDVYVAFGRPKGHRGSYKQWEENNVPLTVVFEILSPANTKLEMAAKRAFYDEFGVEEYYEYDPDRETLAVCLRRRGTLRRVRVGEGFVSPRLRIRFDQTKGKLAISYPDGRRFLTFQELFAECEAAECPVEKERKRADQEKKRADGAEQRVAQLMEQLRALGLDPEG